MKRLLLLLTLAVAFTACGNNSNKAKGDPNSPVAQYIELSSQWLELSYRKSHLDLSGSEERRIEDQMERIDGRLEGLKNRYWDYRLTEGDRQMLRDFLEKDLPKYGRTASKKDYRIVEGAITLADLE